MILITILWGNIIFDRWEPQGPESLGNCLMSHSQQVAEQDLTHVVWLSGSALNYWTRLPCSGPPLLRERPERPKGNSRLPWWGLRREMLSVVSLLLPSKFQKCCWLDTGAPPPIAWSKFLFITTLLVMCSLHFTSGKKGGEWVVELGFDPTPVWILKNMLIARHRALYLCGATKDNFLICFI